MLQGVMEYLLPRVGQHVHTLDLAHGKAVSNEVVRRGLLCVHVYVLAEHPMPSLEPRRGERTPGIHCLCMRLIISKPTCNLADDVTKPSWREQ